MFCRECGKTIKEGSAFCTNCGTKIPTELEETLNEQREEVTEAVTQEAEVAGETILDGAREAAFVPDGSEIPDMPKIPDLPDLTLDGQDGVEEATAVSGTYISEAEEELSQAPAKVAAVTGGQQKTMASQSPVKKDPREDPMTLWGWIGTWLLMLIPIAQVILPFVWAFSSNTNRSKRTFFQAYLIISLVLIVLGIVFGSALFMFFSNVSEDMFY